MLLHSSIHLSQVSLRDLLHLSEDHRRHLFRVEGLHLPFVLHFHLGLATIIDHLKGPVLHVRLNHWVIKASTNQALGIC